ncbi:class I SAM-dependent methyltransferase [bacterium SCSIO 12741]|nr:class I SAM-dependent methyltransferase [bacterium SCSIO 12741]
MASLIELLEKSPEFEKKDGIWFYTEDYKISYPDEGNHVCFEIEDGSFWFNHRNDCIAALVDRFLEKDEVFCDIGGGNGVVSKHLQKSGQPCVLVEPGPNGAANAAKRGVEHVICSTLQVLPSQENFLDAAGAFDVVEHIEDDVAFVKKIHESIKPGGHFISTVPAFQTLWSSEDVEAGHYRRYTMKTYTELLEKCGFEVDYISYLFAPLIAPIFLLRSLPYKLGRRKGAEEITDQAEGSHSSGGGIVENILNSFWAGELNKVKNGQRIGVGSSVIAVGRKKG